MKLFYSPGACSLASHIALEETGTAFEPVVVKLTERAQRRPEYLAINPKGRVPALADGDFVVTENPAILRYIARKCPWAGLWPDDPRDEARCAEWLAWTSSTIHPTYSHMRRPERYATGDEAKADVVQTAIGAVRQLWTEVDRRIAALPGEYLLGWRYSVADIYLFVFWTWGRNPAFGFDMERDLPAWTAHARRVGARPAVKRALEREGVALP
jgi:glutathione S-transferase